jgi:hypothetical protein
MFAGHVAAGLAAARFEPRVNVGVFISAALLLDGVLWVLILAGLESVAIPADFARTHQPAFDFPYSHGLLASIGWSIVAAVVAFAWLQGRQTAVLRAAALVAAAVFSHWMLDALVHRPELPVVGPGSPKLGLGLWQDMPVALLVEAALVVVGLRLFLPASGLSRGRARALLALVLVVLALTVVGMTVAPPPPSAVAMATSSLVTLLAVCGLAFWCGRRPHAHPVRQ